MLVRLFSIPQICFAMAMTFVILSGDDFAQAADVNVGDQAPEFSAKDDTGKDWKSSDFVGEKIVVVYFYPADMTGGCTKQACGFRDDMSSLSDAGVEVIGVSGDEVKNHQLFKKYHNLNFTLLADTEGKVAKAFGVPVRPGGDLKLKIGEQNYILSRGVTTPRWTFVIAKDGKIAYKDTSVKAAEDSQTILKIVEGLK